MEALMIPVNTKRCMHCGKTGTLLLPTDGLQRYRNGAFAQDAFPHISRPLREQFISGTHPKCWDEMFPPEDD